MTTILIQGGNVLDVVNLTFTPADVLVEGGKITQIGLRLIAPAGAKTITAKGKTVMPGLIDCHTHVVASQLNLGLNAKMPNALATLRAVPILSGILMRGFTSVRDAGGADWSLAEATRTDVVTGPRIFPAGRGFSQTGGHGDFRARNDVLDPCACMQQIVRIGVLAELARHRTDDAELIGYPGDMREEIAHPSTRLAVLTEFPGRCKRVAIVVELRGRSLHRKWLAIEIQQSRLWIKGINLRRPTIHVEEDHAARACRKMRGGKRALGEHFRCVASKRMSTEESREREHSETAAHRP